jgi:glycosyltransferase involved in cell wall biosynthesis
VPVGFRNIGKNDREKLSNDLAHSVKVFFVLSFGMERNRIFKWIISIQHKISLCLATTGVAFAKTDVVYCHFLWNLVGASFLSNGYRVPLILALGESDFSIYNKPEQIKQHQALLDKVDAVITVSNKLKSEFLQLFDYREENITVLPNAVDLQKFRFMLQNKQQCLGVTRMSETGIVAGFVGGLIHRKGIDILIKLIEDFPEVDFVVIGKGKLHQRRNVIFSGVLKHDDLPGMLSFCDVFVFPSRAEGAPNALVEAMACQNACLVSGIREIRDFIPSDSVHWCDTEDYSTWRDALATFVSNRRLLDDYAHRAKEASMNFSLEIRASKVADIMNKVVSRRQ